MKYCEDCQWLEITTIRDLCNSPKREKGYVYRNPLTSVYVERTCGNCGKDAKNFEAKESA